jgi:hypothetical protein
MVAAAKSATNLAETVTDRRADQSGLADDSGNAADEAALAKKIGDLWSLVQFRTYRITCIKKELVVYQADLARELYRYKALLVGSGRSGKWSGFLREVKVPRATADRYVQKWENSLSPVKAISRPSTEEITRIVNRIKPKLLRVLTTQMPLGSSWPPWELHFRYRTRIDQRDPHDGERPGRVAGRSYIWRDTGTCTNC